MATVSIRVARLGDALLPLDLVPGDGSPPAVLRVEPGDLRRWERVARHLARGGLAVATGPWEDILGLHATLEARAGEWVKAGPDRVGRRGRGGARPSRRDWDRLRSAALDRLVVPARGGVVAGATPPLAVPGLLAFAGLPGADGKGSAAGRAAGPCLLLPVGQVRRALAALEREVPVAALEASVVVHQDVLAPRSQQTLGCIRRAGEACRPHLGPGAAVLDMGCGSGCCALLAAWLLADLKPRVVATDHLPQAIATTRANVARFEAGRRIRPGAVTVTAGGDLFEPVARGAPGRFALVIFNAPWVLAPARTPEETATNDPGQATLRRFLAQVPAYLEPGGRVILGYADHGGREALAGLEAAARAAGLNVEALFRDRIGTHRRRRRWQRVYAYVLAQGASPRPGGIPVPAECPAE